MIKAPEYWNKGDRGRGVVIAVIDSGCDCDHVDLKDRIIGKYNFTSDDGGNPENVTDYIGHGTHVAGIIGASQNGKGVVGVAPLCSLLILKALNKNGIIILETIVYDNKEPIALCPKTYQKMRNVWFLPTPSCLKRWLEISNFEILKESTLFPTTFNEQHKTKDATFESLEDFLDKDNPKLTIEGYHAPKRYIVLAKKKVN